MGAKITRKTSGPISDYKSADKARTDIEAQLDILINAIRTPEDKPAVGEIKFLVLEDDGTFHLWSFIDGAGISLTKNAANRTITFTVP